MLERYQKNAGPALKGELDILLADMRSSNYEAALTRFEARLNSPMLSDVVRGLIGVLRGDDSAVYFQMLSHDFKQLELQRLKTEAQKIPPKIRVFSFAMLLCFLLTYLAVICYIAVTSWAGCFRRGGNLWVPTWVGRIQNVPLSGREPGGLSGLGKTDGEKAMWI